MALDATGAHRAAPAFYVDHVGGSGVALFDAVCGRDMEGTGAKRVERLYTPDATTWVKIKNRVYSHAEGERISSMRGR